MPKISWLPFPHFVDVINEKTLILGQPSIMVYPTIEMEKFLTTSLYISSETLNTGLVSSGLIPHGEKVPLSLGCPFVSWWYQNKNTSGGDCILLVTSPGGHPVIVITWFFYLPFVCIFTNKLILFAEPFEKNSQEVISLEKF